MAKKHLATILLIAFSTGCGGGSVPRGDDRAAAFDANDSQRSLRCVAQLAEKHEGMLTGSNRIADYRIQRDFNYALYDLLKGKKVSWLLPVKEVVEGKTHKDDAPVGAVIFQPFGSQTSSWQVYLQCEGGDIGGKGDGGMFRAEGRRDWLATLRKGENIRLEGQIVEVPDCGIVQPTRNVHIVFRKNFKLSPAK